MKDKTGGSGGLPGGWGRGGGAIGRGGIPAARGGSARRVAPRKAAPPATAKRVPARKATSPAAAAKQSSITKMTSGYRPMRNPAIKADVTKRRIGTQGQAAGNVKAKANKEIKAERKARGEYLYDKPTYGRKSVNARKAPSVVNKGQKAAGARYSAAAKKRK